MGNVAYKTCTGRRHQQLQCSAYEYELKLDERVNGLSVVEDVIKTTMILGQMSHSLTRLDSLGPCAFARELIKTPIS